MANLKLEFTPTICQFYCRSERALCTPVFLDLFVYIGIDFEFPQVFVPQKLNLDIIRNRIIYYLHSNTHRHRRI